MGESLHSLHKYEHYAEHKLYETENGFDPGKHFYNISNNCEFYSEEQFSCNVEQEGELSVTHFQKEIKAAGKTC